MAEIDNQRFCRFVNALRVFCQVFCVVPVIEFSEKGSITRRLHNIWCFLILLFIYVATSSQVKIMDLKRPTIEIALYSSEFLTNCAIVTTLIINAYYYTEQYREVPDQLRFLEGLTRNYEMHTSLYTILLRELRLLSFSAGSFLFSCFAVDFIYNEYEIVKSVLSSGTYNLPNLLTSLNLAQYWLALRFICLLYKRLNNALERILLFNANGEPYPKLLRETQEPDLPWTTITNWYRREFPTSLEKTVVLGEFVDYIRGLYSELDTLLSKLVYMFGFIIVLNFFGSFLDLAIEFFSVYKFYDDTNSYSIILFIYKVLWLVLHTGRIFFVLLPNHAIIREKSRTFFILNELPSSSRDIEHAINRFQLHLMVRKRAETACGIIDLDLLFFGSFNTALATYIIFLIQIDLGNVSLQPSANKTN